MPRLVDQAHRLLTSVLRPGDAAVDATAGGGRDTLVLAQAVGPTGQVFAFDKQPAAIAATTRLLRAHDVGNVTLVRASHAELLKHVPTDWRAKVRAIAFNLGYLPGGDPSVTTQPESTLLALQQAVEVLAPNGVLSVIAYTGHPGGMQEAETVANFLHQLQSEGFTRLDDPTQPVCPPAPRLMAVVRASRVK